MNLHTASITKKIVPSPQMNLEPSEIAARATDAYSSLCKEFQKAGSPVDFDFRKHCIEWTSRGDHLTHRLHRYPARLTPYIPLFFLAVRDVAVPGGLLLDPFAGCGTVLVEAPVHPAHPMRPIGFEINPLARLIAKVKTTPLDARAVMDAWRRILARYEADISKTSLPDFPNKRHWFTLTVELRLARVLRAMEGLRDGDLRDFFLVAASSVVRQVSLADPGVSVPVKIAPERFRDDKVRSRAQASLSQRERADVLAILDETVHRNLSRLRSWVEAASITLSGVTIRGADARTFATSPYVGGGRLGGEIEPALTGVDLVLTSPPYANAQRYTRSLRLELFALGFTGSSEEESVLDRLQVGTERVPELDWKKMVEPTGVTTADCVIELVRHLDRYRAAIIGKYVRDMQTVVSNCYSVLKPGGHAVFVIGNNCVRGHILDNAAILAELGEQAGFSKVLRVRNRIPSRGLLTKRHPTAGVITHEHVLVLRKSSAPSERH